MHRIAVIGAGYVGLVTAACLADLGNDVVCGDSDRSKIAALDRGDVPFFEPGLAELLRRNRAAGRLKFGVDMHRVLRGRDLIFIAVGTPTAADGHLDIKHVREAALSIAAAMDRDTIVVNKSTVPVQTADVVRSIIEAARSSDFEVTVVSNPEFLREGSAVADFMQPDRIVIGVDHPGAEAVLRDLYAPLRAPIVVTDPRTAEMIKLTANAFLATKISFVNEIANLCDVVGADVRDVVIGAGADRRIGTACMQPGLGFGGSCLPKDVLALHQIALGAKMSAELLDAALAVNAAQVAHLADRLEKILGGFRGACIGLLGLAFKANTDDVRESPALALASMLLERGGQLRAHDPAAAQNAAVQLHGAIRFVDDAYDVADGADAVVLATAWNEYGDLDLAALRARMTRNVLFDMRNVYDPRKAVDAGFLYASVGRGQHGRLESAPSAQRRRSAS